MTTLPDARQIISRDLLSRLVGSSDIQLDVILRALNSEITPPLPLSASATPDLVLQIGSITQSNPTTALNRTVPPISTLIPSFSSGTVTMDSTGAGNATPSVGSALALGMTSSQFLRIGINLASDGTLVLTKGNASGTLGGAAIPSTVDGAFAIGHVVVRTDGSNNVQSVLNSDIYQYIGGSGGGSTGGYARIFMNT